MSKLTELFKTGQLVTLRSESDTSIVLSAQDPQTGEVRRVEISADMAVLPDEAILSVAVSDERDEVNLREWWTRGDTATEGRHVLITPATCPCDKKSDYPCNICDGGLAVCSLCGKGEVELEGPCVPPMNIVSDIEPLATWMVTPNGEYVDLRTREGAGLF